MKVKNGGLNLTAEEMSYWVREANIKKKNNKLKWQIWNWNEVSAPRAQSVLLENFQCKIHHQIPHWGQTHVLSYSSEVTTRLFPAWCGSIKTPPGLCWSILPFLGRSNHPRGHSSPTPGSLFPNWCSQVIPEPALGGEKSHLTWRSPSHLHLSKTVAEELLPAPNHVLD